MKRDPGEFVFSIIHSRSAGKLTVFRGRATKPTNANLSTCSSLGSESLNFRTAVIDIVHTREGPRQMNEKVSRIIQRVFVLLRSALCLNRPSLQWIHRHTVLFLLPLPCSSVRALRTKMGREKEQGTRRYKGVKRRKGGKKTKRRSRTSELNPR